MNDGNRGTADLRLLLEFLEKCRALPQASLRGMVVAALRDGPLMEATANAIVEGLEPEVSAAMLELRTLGVAAVDVVRLERAIRRLVEVRRAADAEAGRSRAQERSRETFDGLEVALCREDFAHLRIPGGWRIDLSGIYRILELEGGGQAEKQVSQRPMLLTGIFVDLDTRDESMLLEWSTRMGWDQAAIPAAMSQDARMFVQLRNRGAPINAHGAKDLGRWLDEFEAANTPKGLPVAYTSTRMGFVSVGPDLAGFLWGRTLLTANMPDRDGQTRPSEWGSRYVRLHAEEGRGEIAAPYRSEGTIEGWREAIDLLADQPSAMVAVLASLAAPFLQVVSSAPNMIVDWSGETSAGKTMALRIAASCWGWPKERTEIDTTATMIGTWNLSAASIEGRASMTQGLPLLLDDTQAASKHGRGEFVPQMIYQIASGSGRGRGKADGGLRHTPTWRTILLSTGETPATSLSTDAGTRARVLAIRGAPVPKDWPHIDALHDKLLANYGHAGPVVVRHLLDPEVWDEVRAAYASSHARWSATADTAIARRTAHFMALLELGAMGLRWAGVELDTAPALEFARTMIAQGNEDGDQALAALQTFWSWAVAHEAEFWGATKDQKQPARGWMGSWRQGPPQELAPRPETLRAVLSEAGFDPNAMIEVWRARGWMLREGKDGPWTLKRSVGGGNKKDRCIVLSPAAMLALQIVVEAEREPGDDTAQIAQESESYWWADDGR